MTTIAPARGSEQVELDDPRADIRARLAQGAPLNDPVTEPEYIWSAHVACGGCSGRTLYLDPDDVDQYNADPDLFVAKHFGFETVDEYREWVEARGSALCSERTAAGKLCRNSIGMTYRPEVWRERHRSAPCSVHGGVRS
jgi:hypothetical protein